MRPEHEEALSRAYGQRGYLVIAQTSESKPHRIGDVIDDVCFSSNLAEEIGQPVRVVGETDFDDFEEQSKVTGGGPQPRWNQGGHRFYRVESD